VPKSSTHYADPYVQAANVQPISQTTMYPAAAQTAHAQPSLHQQSIQGSNPSLHPTLQQPLQTPNDGTQTLPAQNTLLLPPDLSGAQKDEACSLM